MLFLRQVLKRVEKVITALALWLSFSEMPGELFRERCLVSLVKCLKELICVDGGPALDKNVKMSILSSRFICGKIPCTFEDYEKASRLLRVSRNEGGVLYEHSFFGSKALRADKIIWNGFLKVWGGGTRWK